MIAYSPHHAIFIVMGVRRYMISKLREEGGGGAMMGQTPEKFSAQFCTFFFQFCESFKVSENWQNF